MSSQFMAAAFISKVLNSLTHVAVYPKKIKNAKQEKGKCYFKWHNEWHSLIFENHWVRILVF